MRLFAAVTMTFTPNAGEQRPVITVTLQSAQAIDRSAADLLAEAEAQENPSRKMRLLIDAAVKNHPRALEILKALRVELRSNEDSLDYLTRCIDNNSDSMPPEALQTLKDLKSGAEIDFCDAQSILSQAEASDEDLIRALTLLINAATLGHTNALENLSEYSQIIIADEELKSYFIQRSNQNLHELSLKARQQLSAIINNAELYYHQAVEASQQSQNDPAADSQVAHFLMLATATNHPTAPAFLLSYAGLIFNTPDLKTYAAQVIAAHGQGLFKDNFEALAAVANDSEHLYQQACNYFAAGDATNHSLGIDCLMDAALRNHRCGYEELMKRSGELDPGQTGYLKEQLTQPNVYLAPKRVALLRAFVTSCEKRLRVR